MTVTDQGVVAFELERFVAAGTRLEVTGRWRGVRGRRFMRPTLTIEVDGREARALADLEHKPWAPEEDAEWTAAFDWSGEWRGVERFELAVTPDIAVYLPAPARNGAGAASHEDDAASQEDDAASHEDDAELVLEAVAPAEERKPPDVEDRQEALSQRRREQAAAELKAAFAARNEAIEERDLAVADSERLVAECERLMDQHGELVGRRELALAERDATADALAAAVQERDHALSALAATIQERDIAVAELADAIPTRERTSGELASAVDERDRAIAGYERAASEVRELREQLGRVRRELAAQPPPAQAPPPVAAAPAAPVGPPRVVRPLEAGVRWRSRAGSTALATRLLALAALATFIVVLLLIIASK